MLRLPESLKGIFIASCIAATLTAVAILAFGAPPVTLVFVTWGGLVGLSGLRLLADRRLGKQRPSSSI